MGAGDLAMKNEQIAYIVNANIFRARSIFITFFLFVSSFIMIIRGASAIYPTKFAEKQLYITL
jgi:hypothetical protein